MFKITAFSKTFGEFTACYLKTSVNEYAATVLKTNSELKSLRCGLMALLNNLRPQNTTILLDKSQEHLINDLKEQVSCSYDFLIKYEIGNVIDNEGVVDKIIDKFLPDND
jgi:hypothetical protein